MWSGMAGLAVKLLLSTCIAGAAAGADPEYQPPAEAMASDALSGDAVSPSDSPECGAPDRRLGVCPDATILVEILTDFWPSDTTWEIVHHSTGEVVASDGPLAGLLTLYSWDVCVDSTGCFDFKIYDATGDGICCGEGAGYYNVYYNGVLAGSGGDFVWTETVSEMGGGCGGGGVCGDGTCDPDEDCASCPKDCGECLYCDACYTDTAEDWITRVRFDSIDNTTGQDGDCSYGDYTSISTSVAPGATHALRVSFYSGEVSEQYVRAWIDWDQDLIFEVSESYYVGSGIDTTLTRDITIPTGAVLGCTRMRVIENFNWDPTDPCPDLFYGETEDYTVCVAGCVDATITVAIMTDGYPEDTSWVLVESLSGIHVASGGPFPDPNTLYVEQVCVDSAGCYDFVICDGSGDGICCTYGDGYYNLFSNGIPVGSGGVFGSSDTVLNIGGGCGAEVPGDFNGDGLVTLLDHEVFATCMAGPGVSVVPGDCSDIACRGTDMDSDDDVDLADMAQFENLFSE